MGHARRDAGYEQRLTPAPNPQPLLFPGDDDVNGKS